MDLSLAHTPALLALAALGAGALTWWSYGRTTPQPTGWRRGVLVGLRFASLFVVLLLLFEPVLRRVVGQDEEPVLAVLVDASRSLTRDPQGGQSGPAPAERLRAALGTLPRGENVRVYTFAEDATRLAVPLDSLRFEGERTDVARALARVERDLAGQNLRGVLLLSDGRWNAGRNPVHVAARSRVPVYTAVVGDSVSSRDARVAEVVTNDVAYVGSQLPVRVVVRSNGYAGTRATVTLSESGRVMASAPVALPADGAEATVDLTVTPSAPGFRRYVAAVSRQAGEATYRNNAESAAVRVLSEGRRVLLLAAAPGPDLAALRTVLDADRPFETTVRTQRAPGVFYEGPLPDRLDRFDLVVLAGYPGRAADPATAGRVAEAVGRGLPALFLLSRQTDFAALDRLFGDVLPAAPQLVRPGWAEAAPAVTPAGQTHPVLALPGAPPNALGGLPPLDASESRWAVAGDARVLATTRRDGVDTGAPLLVVRGRAGVRTAALLGAGSWRWRTLPDDLAALAGVYPALVENLVRWTTAREDRRPVRVRPTRATFGERERVTFVGQVYDESLQPVLDAEIRVVLIAPGGARTTGRMRAAGNGRYTLDAGPLPAGTYRFEAVASQSGRRLGDDAGGFAVGALAVEFREPGADPALMRQIALRSGGEVVALDGIGDLRNRLAREGRFAPRTVERERETPLLDLPLLLGLVVACLTTEWVLRKRNGMV